MGTVSVRCHNESVVPFGKAFCQFIANFVCFIRRDLTWLEGLSNLISNHIPFLVLSCDVLILPFGK